MNKDLFRKKPFLAIFFAVFDLALFLAVFFLTADIVRSSTELSLVKNEFSLLEKKEESFVFSRKALRESLAETETVNSLFIDKETPVGFIAFLEDVSQAAGFPTKVRPVSSPAAKGDSWPSLLFQISGQGRAINLLKFLDKLETGPYLLKIVDFSVRNLPLTEKEFELDLNVRAYSN